MGDIYTACAPSHPQTVQDPSLAVRITLIFIQGLEKEEGSNGSEKAEPGATSSGA